MPASAGESVALEENSPLHLIAAGGRRLFDRVRDERSGEASPTLGRALDGAAYVREPDAWERALEEFRRWLGQRPLVVRT